MINAGTDLKYRVETEIAGFNLSDNNFTITVSNRWGQVLKIIRKADMLFDSFGNYYFTLEAVPTGVYYAKLAARREDEDFTDGIQTIVDQRYLVSVGTEESMVRQSENDGSTVAYIRVWTVNLVDGVYLADVYGNPIVDANGNRIRLTDNTSMTASVKLNMTAGQLKQLLEGHTANGKIDTIPEMMDSLGGMGDDTEFSVASDHDIDDMMSRVLGS